MPDVVAVIPTFRPDPGEVRALVATLRRADVPTLVVDDASPPDVDPLLDALRAAGADVIRHTTNAGIARSLNDGLAAAIAQRAGWLLTIDQDSVIDDDYLARLLRSRDAAVAVLGPHLVGAVGAGSVDDEGAALSYLVTDVRGIATTPEIIQTGSLWSVAALTAIGGFDEALGIDAVDAAACVRLRAAGRRIVIAPGVSISHRIGNARPVHLLGRTAVATGHAPQRRTTIVRNRLRLAREEFRQSPVHAWRTLRRMAVATVLAVTVEDDRWAKAKASLAGLRPVRSRGR